MNFEILVDGQQFVKADLNLQILAGILQEAAKGYEGTNAKSTPATEAQMRDLLSRIDQRSVQYLRMIAASDDGMVTWLKMREIFGIEEENDWPAYSGSFGKGITRAYRKILGDKTAQLIWWIDKDWDENDWDSNMCCVYIDGPALSALRAATAS